MADVREGAEEGYMARAMRQIGVSGSDSHARFMSDIIAMPSSNPIPSSSASANASTSRQLHTSPAGVTNTFPHVNSSPLALVRNLKSRAEKLIFSMQED